MGLERIVTNAAGGKITTHSAKSAAYSRLSSYKEIGLFFISNFWCFSAQIDHRKGIKLGKRSTQLAEAVIARTLRKEFKPGSNFIQSKIVK